MNQWGQKSKESIQSFKKRSRPLPPPTGLDLFKPDYEMEFYFIDLPFSVFEKFRDLFLLCIPPKPEQRLSPTSKHSSINPRTNVPRDVSFKLPHKMSELVKRKTNVDNKKSSEVVLKIGLDF